MWVLIFAVIASLVAYSALAAWHGRLLVTAIGTTSCGRCGGALEPVGEPIGAGHRSYELLSCHECRDVITTVHGSRSPFAYCPSCRQLSLEVKAKAHGALVEIHEACQICGYAGEDRIGSAPAAEESNVIPFPRRPGDDPAP